MPRGGRTPNPIVTSLWRGVVLAAIAAGTAWGWIAYAGPWRWASEAQLFVLEAYSPKLSVGICAILWGLPFFLVQQYLVRRGIVAGNEWGRGQADFGRQPLNAKQIALVFGPMGVVGACVGGYLWWYASQAAAPVIVTASDIEGGATPPSPYVDLKGWPEIGSAVGYGSSPTPDDYLAVHSEEWQPGRPVTVVAVFAANDHRTPKRPGEMRVRGMIRPDGVPGPVRAELKRHGYDADRATLIDVGARPESWRFFGMLGTFGGGLLVCLAVTAAAVSWARRSPEQPSLLY